MAIGNDDFDFEEEELDLTKLNDDTITQDTNDLIQDDEVLQDYENNVVEEEVDYGTSLDDLINSLLLSKGIEDPAKIKFENDNGEIEEVDWSSLNNEDKFNILNSSSEDQELDESEIDLINAIRESNLSPAEYLQQIQKVGIETYMLNVLNQQQAYTVDLYNDDELYIMDLISKSEDITEEEALEALERAKSNKTLFKKLIDAVRKEYLDAEKESIQYSQLQLEQNLLAQYNQFAEKIEDSIINFKEFAGCELNMSQDDMQDVYDFITGFDNAGNNWFSKTLNDTDSVVQMAWFLLYGEKMILDINEYYLNEITNVRKESYNKGLKDASKNGQLSVTYKPKGKSNVTQSFDDLDDF